MKRPCRTQIFRSAPCKVLRQRQHGVSLMVVLMALVLMSLAAVGLIRMVDTGTLVAGNLAFKQGATSVADITTGAAITVLQGITDTTQDSVSKGYYATSKAELDVTAKSTSGTRILVDWNDDNCAYASGDFATCIDPTSQVDVAGYTGYQTNYLITRMCNNAGDTGGTNSCAKPVSTASGSSSNKGENKYGSSNFTAAATPYYRIVVRSEGPRKTVSFTETYVHF